jgi:hypothetical protein
LEQILGIFWGFVQLEGKEGRGKGKRRNDRRNFSYKNNPKKRVGFGDFFALFEEKQGKCGGKIEGG